MPEEPVYSMRDKIADKVVQIALGVMVAVIGFMLMQIFNMNAELRGLKETISRGADQKATISKHWRLIGWTRDQINELRHKEGMPLVAWPDTTPQPTPTE